MAERFGQWGIESVKQLMDKMAETGLGELSVEDGDFKLSLSARQLPAVPAAPAAFPPAVAAQAVGTAVEVNVQPAEVKASDGNVVKSPIVGTFYASAAPDKPPFVSVGSRVKKGDTLFVIESMKLMNEIQSDYAGVVSEILVENAQGVEFNQPVMVIQ